MISPLELRPGLRRDIAISKIKLGDKEKHNGDHWPTHDSDFFDYMDRFSTVLDGYKIIDELQSRPSPVLIDLMSSTDALASIFYDLPQKDKLGIVVGRSDTRTPWQKARDEGLGIHLISEVKTDKGMKKPADVTSWKTWRTILETLEGRKADLIVECGGLGLDFVPVGSEFHMAVARWAWRLLSPNNGLLLAQTRTAPELEEQGISLDEWVKKLNGLGIPSKRAEDKDERIATISLRKTPNSPARLPL